MPKGPKGQKRPADVVSNAIKVARIATGEEDDAPPVTGKDADWIKQPAARSFQDAKEGGGGDQR